MDEMGELRAMRLTDDLSTPLEAVLKNPSAARPTPLRAFDVARDKFFSGERIDMGDLAAETGVSRATLNRWVGSREKLLGEVLYSIADAAFSSAERNAEDTGASRVVSVLNLFFTGVLSSGPYRRFVTENPELALNICASKAGPVQARLITRIEAVLQGEDIDPGAGMTLYELAYALLRIGESFVYNDVITGATPNVTAATAIWRRMLEGATTS